MITGYNINTNIFLFFNPETEKWEGRAEISIGQELDGKWLDEKLKSETASTDDALSTMEALSVELERLVEMSQLLDDIDLGSGDQGEDSITAA